MSRIYTELGRYEQLFDQLEFRLDSMDRRVEKLEAIDRRATKLQASKEAYRRYSSNYDTDPYQQPTRFRPCHEHPPGWPPPQRVPPSYWPAQRRRHTYEKQHQAHAYRQPEFPLPDRTLHPPTPRSPSCRRSAPPCTALADSPAATTQSRACQEQPTVVMQPLLGPTSLQRSAIPLMAPAAVPPPSSHLHHDPSSPSLPVVAAVPPSILTPPSPSCCPNLSRDEGELLHDDPPLPAPILQLCNSDISEEETLLEDKEEDDSIGEVEKIMASFSVAQITLKDVENCWFKRGSIVHRSTSLDVDARFIPPRNDTPYLSLLGGDKGRYSVVRYVFDPGGDASPKRLLSTLVVALWFPP